MLAADVKANQRVRVVHGPNNGREGHVITLPIPGSKGIVVLDDEEMAFWVQEEYLEPVVMEVQHDQQN